MLIRYFLWLAVALAAVFLVIASASFTSLAAIASLTFGISICTLVVSVGIAYRYRDHLPTLLTAIMTTVVSTWTIVASSPPLPEKPCRGSATGCLAAPGGSLADPAPT